MYFSPLHNIFHVAQYFTSAIVSFYSINLQLQHGIGCIMRRIHAKFCLSWTQLMQHIQHWKLCVRSLTYNSYGSAIDAAFEPVFTIVDFAVRWFGVAFVTLVVCLTSSVVIIFYLNVLPFVMETHSSFFAHLHLAYGHYLLLMILFHYYKAVTTDPGTPPTEATNVPVTSICKKCIAPKPPRAHHCSVCRKCRLKMDHHCPWLNNCVGHFNHRYFISFCIFMLLGTSYVSLSSWTIFSDCFGLPEKWLDIKHSLYRITGRSADDMSDDIRAVKIRHDFGANICKGRGRFFHSGTVYLWLLCSAVTVALGCLTMWHIYLISRAETSIDHLMNRKERQRMKKLKLSFSNPYSFGLVDNWKRLLGFKSIRSFITRVLLPSAHLPDEDGVRWKVSRFQRTVVT